MQALRMFNTSSFQSCNRVFPWNFKITCSRMLSKISKAVWNLTTDPLFRSEKQTPSRWYGISKNLENDRAKLGLDGVRSQCWTTQTRVKPLSPSMHFGKSTLPIWAFLNQRELHASNLLMPAKLRDGNSPCVSDSPPRGLKDSTTVATTVRRFPNLTSCPQAVH